MKLRSFDRSETQRYNNQHGIALTITALCLLVLISLICLVIAAGSMYRTKLRLQRATDAGSLAAVKFIRDESNDTVIRIARETVRNNLGPMGIDPNSVKLNINLLPLSDPTRVSIDTTYTAPLNFLPFPFKVANPAISAHATSEFDRLILTLVLDVSGSMWCSADPTQTCSQNCLDKFNCPGKLRIELLQEAIKSYLLELNPERDKLSIIAFTGAPELILPFHVGSDYGFNLKDARDAIDSRVSNTEANFGRGKGTKMGTALRTTLLSYSNLQIKGKRSVILVTDGAPIGEEPAEYSQHFQPCGSATFRNSNMDSWFESSKDFFYAIAQGDALRQAGIGFNMLSFPTQPLGDENDPNYLFGFKKEWHLYANKNFGNRLTNSTAYRQSTGPDYQGVTDSGGACGGIVPKNDPIQKKSPGLYREFNGTDPAGLLEDLRVLGRSIPPRITD